MGRFITPDFGGPLLIPDPVPWAEFDDPQTLNLYSYVRNIPTTGIDPDGHDCVVQTRTGDKTEDVSVSSGNCDNVKVGDGQSKTYVPGTTDVSRIHAGSDGKSIDIGYTPYEGGGTGVFNAAAAPYPDNPNLAYGFNKEAYRTLTQASMTVDRIGWATVGMMGVSTLAMAAGGGGLTTLGDLAIEPTAGEQAYAERLLAQGGKKAVEKAIKTLSKRLAEHEAKVGTLQGNPGSVEREIAGFVRTIQALSNVLK